MVRRFTTAVALAALAAVPAAAQTVVVTPSNPQGWAPNSVNAGSSTGITNTQPRSGTGSLEVGGTQSGGVAIRTRFEKQQDYGLLSSLTSFSFDWRRDGSSTVGGIQAPAFRLLVASTDPGATSLRYSEFIWEYAYNGPGNAPTDSWESVTTSLTSGIFWRFVSPSSSRGPQAGDCSFNPANPAPAYQTLGAWISSGCVGADARIYGISAGVGSIPASNGQTFRGYADNIGIQAGGANQPIVYNFEVQSTAPEPSTYALLGAGLLGLGGALRRRRARR